ncbi:MAG: DsbA family oxidoreductase [Acidimicrobiales bacterium]
MKVDVWSDVVCPWCFVGLANLHEAQRALAADGEAEPIEVVLHSFQLDPGAPERIDEPILDRLVAKLGMPAAQVQAGQDRLVAMGAERGIDFRFDQAIDGNTFDAHRLLHLARQRGLQLELKERLGRAYFTDGQPIGERPTLRQAALDVGLDEHEVDAVLEGDAYADDVRADIAAAQRIGIGGVPFFVIDERYGVSGAQPAEVLRDALEEAIRTKAPSLVTVAGDPEADACGPEGCAI